MGCRARDRKNTTGIVQVNGLIKQLLDPGPIRAWPGSSVSPAAGASSARLRMSSPPTSGGSASARRSARAADAPTACPPRHSADRRPAQTASAFAESARINIRPRIGVYSPRRRSQLHRILEQRRERYIRSYPGDTSSVVVFRVFRNLGE